MRKKPTPEQRLVIEERRKEVARLLKMGYSYREIADALLLDEWFGKCGISPATVASDVKVILARYRKESVQLYADRVTLQEARLNVMLAAIWPKVLEGKLLAIDRAIRIEERRAKLFGLDTYFNLPMKDVKDMSDEEIEQILSGGKPPLQLVS